MEIIGEDVEHFSCSRKKLVDIIFSSKYKNFDRKFEEALVYLRENTNCNDDNKSDLVFKLRHFKYQFKSKWEKYHRTRSHFYINESNWLKEILKFPKYRTTGKANIRRVGRPAQDFDSSSDQIKRKRTAELRGSVSTSELVFAAQMSLRADGKKEASDVVKRAPDSLNYTAGNKNKETKKLSALDALSMLIEAKLSRNQYNVIRRYAPDMYPSYKEVQEQKKQCYPEGIIVTENAAEVPIQNLLDHITENIIKIHSEIFDTTVLNNELNLISKWGFDGSSGHSQYHQKYIDDVDTDDKFVFITCLVPLQLQHNNKVIWQNPCPSSPRYCRPISIIFEKESTDLVIREKRKIEEQIEKINTTILAFGSKQYVIKHQLTLSMIDGKLVNSLSDTTSALRCYLCQATSKQFNDIDQMTQLPINEDFLSFGMSVLHAWIRMFECLLHVAYKLPTKEWRKNKSIENVIKENQTRIQKIFREKTGLIIDKPKPGYGNTNTGNVARRFFQKSEISAEVTGIDQKLIERFHVILQCISSGFELDKDKFRLYTLNTARLFVELYPWYPMSTTVHKILIHGYEIVSQCMVPIGLLSEESLEARNKDFKSYRENYSRKTSRKDTLSDIINRMLVSSDPLVTGLRTLNNSQKRDHFNKDAIEIFKQPNLDNSNF